jgi:spore maturation protein B
MNSLSQIVLPLFVLLIIVYGLLKKINLYDTFMEGAKDGLKISLNIIPAIVAMVFAVNIFLDSNFLFTIFSFLEIPLNKLNIPIVILPMAFLRPISGTATLSILANIYASYGPDSFAGKFASVIQGCTDTTIYVLALYFGSVHISKTKYALGVGLFADLVGIIAAFILSVWLFL